MTKGHHGVLRRLIKVKAVHAVRFKDVKYDAMKQLMCPQILLKIFNHFDVSVSGTQGRTSNYVAYSRIVDHRVTSTLLFHSNYSLK